MKTCLKCGEHKPLTEFYKHKQMADGHLNKCKECAKSGAIKHRDDNIEKVRAYDRERGSLPHRVAARNEYQKTDAYKVSQQKSLKKYFSNHPERRAAQTALGNAVRDGRLTPWPVCALPECNAAPEAHHPDYSHPLDVVWLCGHHHKQAHKLSRELERVAA